MGCASSSQKKSKGDQKKGTKVKINIGPLEVGEDGMALKPKFDIGVMAPWIRLNAGVNNIQDGLVVETMGSVAKDYAVSGSSLEEILTEVKAVDPLPVLDDLIAGVPKIVALILEKFGVDIKSDTKEVEGVITAFVSVGIKAGLYLGWVDTEGYRMLGATGLAAAAISNGISTRVGIHTNGYSIRVVQFVSNVGVDVIIHLDKQVPEVPADDQFAPPETE